MKLLITGGCGFIGSNITEYFLENNLFESIIIIDNLSTGFMNNIQNLLDKHNNLKFIEGNIQDIEVCRNITKNIDAICHQAATGSVPRSINDPFFYHKNNVDGFFNLLIAAKENGCKRFVYASSSSVYGDNESLPKIEDKTGNVLSPYAATKKINEIYANVFHKCYGMEIIGLRYFNVFGEKQNPNGEYAAVIPKFIDYVKNLKSPTIFGDGSFSRDFTYVKNVVQANYLALTTTNQECFGEIFNIGAGGRISINEIFYKICEIMGANITPNYQPNRKGDIPHSNASIEKANHLLGYTPEYGFEEGLKRTIEYFAVT
jgi:UDP-N-acetylglucosamine/UDP-N-acetylgalactosamine 4-epimerase